ncbi:MAG: NAD(+) synthase [candidate division Zixibacteria bacterium]|nr:NAD(+) synthase [candidate division Zixibacteria bacterium]
MGFSKNSLKINAEEVADHICNEISRQIGDTMNKRGAVVGISGGIDSSVVAALCVRAVGAEKVLGVMMPEKDSASESKSLAIELANKFGFETVIEELTQGLDGIGCYRRRDEAIRRVFPEFDDTYKSKIIIPTNLLDESAFNYFTLTIEAPDGTIKEKRMPLSAYLQIVAASNLKQRLRMTTLYYHAERLNKAVVGTGNKDEHEQGFFVKYGDGGADLKPIAHLFKVQVYQLAEFLGIPESIIKRTPTTDTYSSEVTQKEFFFGLDFYTMDMLWHAMETGVPPKEAADVLNLTVEQVERGYTGIKRKIDATRCLRMNPLEIE